MYLKICTLLHCCTLLHTTAHTAGNSHTAAHTAAHCHVHNCTHPRIAHIRAHCRTLLHCLTAAHCPAHYHTLLSALPHTGTCTAALIHAQPHTSVRAATHYCRTATHCHMHCRTLLLPRTPPQAATCTAAECCMNSNAAHCTPHTAYHTQSHTITKTH
jgi:hypothetical protein